MVLSAPIAARVATSTPLSSTLSTAMRLSSGAHQWPLVRPISSCAMNSARPQLTVSDAPLGDLALGAGGKVEHDQFIVANEGHEAALAADRRVELGFLGVGQAANLPREVGEVDVAIERHQQRLAVGRPVVSDDAGQIGDARALALHPLGFAQLGAGGEFLAVDEHARRAGGGVDRPQIIAFEVVGTAAQQRDQLAVGRQLQRARHLAGQRRAGENAVERQLLGCGWTVWAGRAVEVSKAASPANRRA